MGRRTISFFSVFDLATTGGQTMPECQGQLALWDSAVELWKTLHPCPVCANDRVALGHYIASTTDAEIGDPFVDFSEDCGCGIPLRLSYPELARLRQQMLAGWDFIPSEDRPGGA